MRNNNSPVIKTIIGRTLSSDKKRNFFILAAIALTAFMITSVFSIGASYFKTMNMHEKRMQGSISQMAFIPLSEEQLNGVYSLDYVKTVGIGYLVAHTVNTPKLNTIDMAYVDETQWQKMFCPAYTNISGHYPKGENEIMLSRYILEAMGIENPKIGMVIPLTYLVDGENKVKTEEFLLSCIYTEYAHSRPAGAVQVYTSYDFAEKNGKTELKNTTVNVIFKDGAHVGTGIEQLKKDLKFSENQAFIQSPAFDDNKGDTATYAAILLIVLFLMFTGYLLIYNVMYISVSRDVRFYGMLKTIGTTPRQLRCIVFGQVLRLCIISLPIGCTSAAAVSLVIVPAVLQNSGIATDTIVSFSPYIYGGAILFTLLTALLGAFAPAKKAAGISPMEALRYTGSSIYKSSISASAKGKPYKMAVRNIFRDRKRTGVVILSLFIGITVFIVVMTTVTSLDIDNAVNAEYNYDYSFSANSANSNFLSDDFIDGVNKLDGIAETGITTIEPAELMYSKALDRYIDWLSQKDGSSKENIIVDDTFAWSHGLKGIDPLTLKDINKSLPVPVDSEAFERGEIAIINVGRDENMADCFKEVSALEIRCAPEEAPVQIAVGGIVSLTGSTGSSFSYSNMEILVSNAFMQKHYTHPQILSLDMNVKAGFDKQIYNTLNETINPTEVVMTSRYAARKAMQEAKTIMFALGGGISCILRLIGIFNFVNVMSVGIMVRKRELATLESIGMEKKKVRRMLVFEGLGYAVMALLLTATAGNVTAYGVFRLFKLWADYAVFTYPIIPVIMVFLLVTAVCVMAPEAAYRTINRTTIAERLKEGE